MWLTACTEFKKIHKYHPQASLAYSQGNDGWAIPQDASFQTPNTRPSSDQTIVFLMFLHGLWLLKPESSWDPASSLHPHGYLVQATILSCLVHFHSILASSPGSALVPKALSQQRRCSHVWDVVGGDWGWLRGSPGKDGTKRNEHKAVEEVVRCGKNFPTTEKKPLQCALRRSCSGSELQSR